MELSDIKRKLQADLSTYRYKHCLRVANKAKHIAKQFDIDQNKAYLTGLLHDVAKEKSNDEIIDICKNYNITLGKRDLAEAHYLHGIAGSIIAEKEYGINDKEILTAIANHAGRPDMTDLEKVIMMSDFIDLLKRHDFDLDSIDTEGDLDSFMLSILKPTLTACVQYDSHLAERTGDAFDYIMQSKIFNKKSDKIMKFKSLEYEEQIFDKAIETNKRNKLKLKSVFNIRDLGMYGVIKKHQLIRSANLSKLSKEDSDYLYDYGIRTIIDLRGDNELKDNPDINVDKFNYYNTPLPLPTPELEYLRNRMLERKEQTFSMSEDIWYNVQYFRTMDMQEMYKNILLEKSSIKQISKIFKIILEAEGGVLFHCTSGKDRTGLISIMLMYILGFSSTQIDDDYFASIPFGLANAESTIMDMYLEGYENNVADEARRVLGVDIESLPTTNELIINKYGNFNNYLDTEIKFYKKDRDKLRKKYKI